MAAAGNIHVRIDGFAEIQKVLKELPMEVKHREVMTVMRKNAQPALRVMKAIVPFNNDPERADKPHMREAVALRNGKKKRDAFDVYLGVQNKGRGRAPHWHLVAFGTDVRQVDSYKTKNKTKGKLVARKADGTRGIRVALGGSAFAEVRFITNTGRMPALDYAKLTMLQTGNGVTVQMGQDLNTYMSKRAERLIQKYKV